MGRIIKILEECYGVKKGNNQHKEESANGTTQKEVAEQLGMNQYVNEEVDGNNFRQANLASEIGLDERQLRN